MIEPFDEHAQKYDTWFLKNKNVLESEVRLMKHFLSNPGKALSVGCGSGLFEYILKTQYDIVIQFGVEPTDGMAKIAEKRGIKVKRGFAENLPFDDKEFDTVILNGTPSYIKPLELAFQEALRVLKPNGHIVVADVPAESSYGLLYCFASKIGNWQDEYLKKIAPLHPYPIEFAAAANWRTTEEKIQLLKKAGFKDFEYAQTLTCHPKFSNDLVEDPIEGFDRGDYVAIRARK